MGSSIDLARVERRRVLGGPRPSHQSVRCFTSSVSFGTISCRSPTTPRSQNSKIGAFGSLLIATIVARALHADLVLDRARDAAGDVELRRDRLAGLADLGRVRVPAGVDDRARRGDRAAERLRQLLDEREALRAAEPAAAGDDHVRVLDRRAVRLLVRLLDHRRLGREVLERRRAAPRPRPRRRSRPGRTLPGAEERRAAASPVQPTSTYDASRSSAGRLPTSVPPSRDEVDEIPVQAGVEPRGEAGGDVGGQHRGREEHGVDSPRRGRAARARRPAAAAAAPRAPASSAT